MKNVGPALIAVLLSITINSILAAVLIPLLDSVLTDTSAGIRSALAIALILALLGMIYGLSVLLYDSLLKRAQRLEQKKKAEQDPNFKRRPAIAFIVLVVICFAIVAYQLFFSTDRNTNITSLIGEKAVYGLIIWSLFNHFFGKHLNQHSRGFSFVVVLAVFITGSYWTAERRGQAEAESLARIQENVLSLFEEDEDGRMAPVQTIEGRGSGELATMEASLNDYLNQVVANGNNYLTELDAIGYNSLVDSERIRNDAGLAESRFIIERAEAIVDKYEQLNEQAAYDFRDSVAGQFVSAADRESFRASFDEKLEPNLERARQSWNLERDLLTKAYELVSFLAISESSWTKEDDQYIFETDKNLAIFNQIFDEIDVMSAQQDALTEEGANLARGFFDDLTK